MVYVVTLKESIEDKINGYSFIHTKSELDRIVVDNINSNKIIIRQDFISEFFTPSGLISYVDNVKKINCTVTIEIDTVEDTFHKSTLINKLAKCRNADEMLMFLGAYEKEFMDIIQLLIKSYTDGNNKVLDYSNQVARLQATIEDMSSEIEDLNIELQTENNNKLSYQSKFHALVQRINYQYNKSIDEEHLFEVDSNSYDKVIYIKELSRVQYTDTFIYYLKEILKSLYGMPTRTVVIESYYADGKIPQYPNFVPHNALIERDVISGDILMLGMQPNLMKDILKNASNISILIVLDRGGNSAQHITGPNVETFYTVSDIKDAPVGVPADRVISYSDNTLFIKYLKEFDDMDIGSKINAYSSMNIIKKFISVIENK